VSVGKDGVVSTSFYRALNFALTGVAELTQTAAELVLSYIQKDLGKFSTTLEQDQASLKVRLLVVRLPEFLLLMNAQLIRLTSMFHVYRLVISIGPSTPLLPIVLRPRRTCMPL